LYVYLDTMFLVRLQQNKGDYAKCLASLQHRVASDNWSCVTSPFGIMEWADVLQENAYILQELARGEYISDILKNKNRKERQLSTRRLRGVQKKVTRWLESHPDLITVEKIPGTSEQLFRLASVICLNGTIMAPDAIHLAAALQLGCDLILTNDELFIHSVNKELANKKHPLRVRTFEVLAEITGAPVQEDELDEEGKIITACSVQMFLNKYPPPQT